jgi:bifunctional non-homologous end joining protein LigD
MKPYQAGGPPDPGHAVQSGELQADLSGEKLRGHFMFGHTRTGSGKEDWLLHKHDEYASDGWSAEDHPRSVLTGCTNDEVQANPDRMWRSDLPATRASVPLEAQAAEPPTAGELDALKGFGVSGAGTSSAASCASRTSTSSCFRRAAAGRR